MNRLTEIDDFLKYYASIYKSNPNLTTHRDLFYNSLMSYDCYEEFRKSTKEMFPTWQQRYNQSNLHAFISDLQPRFLQIWSKHNFAKASYDYKLYLNLPYENLEEGVTRIFDYLNSHNIENHSKVADVRRADEIVLRIPKKEDVIKVLNYINNDPFFLKHSKSPNPFIPRYGIVGVAYDYLESYNGVVSDLLSQYFSTKTKNKELNSISLKDFTNFVQRTYYEIFQNPKNMHQFFDQPELQNYTRHPNKESQILNYQNIIKLVIKSLQGNLLIERFITMIEQCKEQNIAQKELRGISDTYYNRQNNQSSPKTTREQKLLDDYIALAISMYGLKGAAKYLESYTKGSIKSITRTNGFRRLFEQYLTPSLVLEIVDYNIDNYIVEKYLEIKKSKYDLFKTACKTTYQKYGLSQLVRAINESFTGNFNYLTENGQERLRTRLKEQCTKEDIRNICDCILFKNTPYQTRNEDIALATIIINQKDELERTL